VDQLKQDPLIYVTLEEFSLVGFFNKAAVNVTTCAELEDEEDGEEDKLENSLESDDKTMIILEALLAHT